MKILKIIGLCLLISCSNHPIKPSAEFQRILPDTTKSWAGRMTREDYLATRIVERKLHLETLSNGVRKQEFRVWHLHGFYDPQSLLILNRSNTEYWNLRIISFYQSDNDSVSSDYTKMIHTTVVDDLKLDHCWSLASQSDLKAGDSYGCVDGENVFVEIADSTKYRFMWYRCPNMHTNKDSAFLFVSELTNKLNGLTVEH